MELFINEKISSKNVLDFLKAEFIDAKTKVHAFQLYKGNELMVRLAPTPYSNTYKRQMYSVSKSFAATAIGIACDMGILKVTDKLCDIFRDEMPENPSEYLLELNVWHLLTMSVGHNGCCMKKISLSDNGVKAFLETEIVNKPGTKYCYDTGASYMLSAVLTKLTGISMLDFLNMHLFRHMGIENVKWPFCGGDINEGGIGIRLSADDLAKFGLLYLNKGVYNGKRLLSESFTEEATKGYLDGDLGREPDWKSGYGYQIWRNEKGGYRADGAFGQYCIVVPEKDIIMVLLVESENVEKELSLCFDYMDKFFESDTDTKELESFLESCYAPCKSSETITSESRLYMLSPNLNNITFAETSNTGKEFILTLHNGECPQKIIAGNGKYIENNIQLRGFKPQLYGLTSETALQTCRFLASFKAEKSYAEIELKHLDCPHITVLKVSEKNNELSVDIAGRPDTLPEKPFHIDGKLI